MTGKIRPICGLAVLSLALGGNVAEAGVPPARLVESWSHRQLTFEENRGQTGDNVRFLARGSGYNLFLTSTEAVLALRTGESGRVLRLRWEGAAPAPRVSGEAELPGRSHYLLGNDPSKWKTGIPSFGKVRYRSVYPGVDLVFYGNQGQLEFDLVIAPGADPRAIRLTVEGADRLEIDSAGDLVLHLMGGEVRLRKPIAYQESEGMRKEIAAGYRLRGPGGLARVEFETAAYDVTEALVIDPILSYSTFFGGQGFERGNAILTDAAGNVYVTGLTSSPDLPTPGAVQPFLRGAGDIYIVKFDPNGNLAFCTYLGGSLGEEGAGLAIDTSGIYVSGWTASPDFPLANPGPPPHGGSSFDIDVYVAKLSPSGSTLLYSTRLGGSGHDFGGAIAVSPNGSLYVAGTTPSPDFPVVNPLSSFQGGPGDGFVAKLSPSGSLVFSTYFGGSGSDANSAIAIGPAGHIYLVGSTSSPDFPTVNPLHGFAGAFDAFVAKLDPSGNSFLYSTFLGGEGGDSASSIAIDDAGNVYVAGHSSSFGFPVLNAIQPAPKGVEDAFVVKLSSTDTLLYSTLLGGDHPDNATDIALDSLGNVYITGRTESTNFPLKDPVQAECVPMTELLRCSGDAFITKLDAQGSALIYSTFLGGAAGFDLGLGIAVDPQGNAYVTGGTESFDFPTINARQPLYGGAHGDAFIAKIVDNQPPGCSAAFAHPATLWPPNGKFVPIFIRGVTDPDGDPVTLTVTAIRQDEPLSRSGVPDAAGLGTPNAQIRADRAGGGDGRVYRIIFEARDGQGGTCAGTVTVCVPRDQGRGRTCGDGGPLFDSD
jgi:Beta-propeller repeat